MYNDVVRYYFNELRNDKTKLSTISKIRRAKYELKTEQHGPQERKRWDQVPRRNQTSQSLTNVIILLLCKIIAVIIGMVSIVFCVHALELSFQ